MDEIGSFFAGLFVMCMLWVIGMMLYGKPVCVEAKAKNYVLEQCK